MKSITYVYRRMINERPSNLVSWAFFVLLWPCALAYRLTTFLRAGLYRCGLFVSYRASVPVISVGNLTVGGTGKTPVVDAVARRLAARCLRIAVVSRGYGGKYAVPVGTVATGDGRLLMTSQQAGDEPCLLAMRNPSLQVYVARERPLGVQAAERAGAQIIILDDGFQHLAVQRHADIVLLDSRSPFGNGQLLPAGPLREAPSALLRADLVIMTHAGETGARMLPFTGPMLYCRHRLADDLRTLDGRVVPWSTLEGQAVLAFAGIARPEDFFAALAEKGVALAGTVALNDHQDYSDDQLNRLFHLCDNYQLLLTTEKDAVKLRAASFPCPCLVVPLSLEFDAPGELDRFLERICERV